MRWRLLHSPPGDGPLNMATDHALMARARHTGETVLRVYEWSAPVLSLGRNQRARDVYVDAELARRGVSVVRRPTGGRALLHHREITYSVTAPASSTASLGATYARVNTLLLDALASLGVPATLAAPTVRSRLPTATPCFAEPAKGEIVVGGRKLAGSAQWRDDGALLQHGSIIVDDDQVTIPSLMREPAGLSVPPATLREILGRAPRAAEIADALFCSVRRMEDALPIALSPAEIDSLDISSQLSLYRDPAWTWRR
ncbi:MAG: lipoate--protein ligase family protein [bacterium]